MYIFFYKYTKNNDCDESGNKNEKVNRSVVDWMNGMHVHMNTWTSKKKRKSNGQVKEEQQIYINQSN